MALYPITEEAITAVENTFSYHKPFGEQPEKYEEIRDLAKGLALRIMNLCPPSRERSLALTNLEQSVMWANKSIAVNEKENI